VAVPPSPIVHVTLAIEVDKQSGTLSTPVTDWPAVASSGRLMINPDMHMVFSA